MVSETAKYAKENIDVDFAESKEFFFWHLILHIFFLIKQNISRDFCCHGDKSVIPFTLSFVHSTKGVELFFFLLPTKTKVQIYLCVFELCAAVGRKKKFNFIGSLWWEKGRANEYNEHYVNTYKLFKLITRSLQRKSIPLHSCQYDSLSTNEKNVMRRSFLAFFSWIRWILFWVSSSLQVKSIVQLCNSQEFCAICQQTETYFKKEGASRNKIFSRRRFAFEVLLNFRCICTECVNGHCNLI